MLEQGRAYSMSEKNDDLKKIHFEPSTVENIDRSVYDYLKDLKLSVLTNEGQKTVPLLWGTSERSFLSKENKEVTIRLYYDERGLDRYYGLLELGEIGGLWKNVAGRYEINGKKVYAKAIYKDPEEYFTEDILQKLDAIAKEEFSYGM